MTQLKAGPRGRQLRTDRSDSAGAGGQGVVTHPSPSAAPPRGQGSGLEQASPWSSAFALVDQLLLPLTTQGPLSAGFGSRPLFWPAPPQASPRTPHPRQRGGSRSTRAEKRPVCPWE